MLQFLKISIVLWKTFRCVMDLKTIHYSSVKHNQILFKYDKIFQSKKSINRPRLQKLLK
jgi:hypothetical protein